MRGVAPGPPRGSQGVLMWVIKSFARIHLEQQPCLTWGVMTAYCSTNRKVAREAVGGTYSKGMG